MSIMIIVEFTLKDGKQGDMLASLERYHRTHELLMGVFQLRFTLNRMVLQFCL